MNKTIACSLAAFAMSSMVTLEASASLLFDQGFESDTYGWLDYNSEVTRVASGTGGIASAEGSSHHATLNNVEGTFNGAFTAFGGYSDVWPNGFKTTQQVYLDPTWSSGTGFDWSVAVSGSDGAHQRDFIFHVAKDTSTNSLLVGGSNNSNFSARQDLDTLNSYAVTQAGWYTFEHIFSDMAGQLAVDMNLLDDGGSTLFTETRTNAGDLIPSVVGGNRYGWFTFNDIDGLAIDNTRLETGTQSVSVPEPASLSLIALGLLGVAVRRKKA
jgi:hypothetical protein